MTMKRVAVCTILLVLSAVLLAGCSLSADRRADEPVPITADQNLPAAGNSAEKTGLAASPVEEEPSPAPASDAASRIDSLLEQMTLQQKVGQLFIVRPDSLDPALTQDQSLNANANGVTTLTDSMRETLERYPVGGIILFGKNILTPDQVIELNEALQSAVEIPLFLSVDEEGGQVARIAGNKAFDVPRYKSAASVASGGDPSAAFGMGSAIGAYLKKYGFNMDFAPVADVNTNPNNPIIGTRAFSSDAHIAAEMAEAMAEGLRQEGITPVFKHFPGHGDTAEDSHRGIAISYKTEADMALCEWLPFQKAGDRDCVMVGHIAVPNITGDSVPASLSYQVVTEILRGKLGFQGLILTDSLQMAAITETYSPGQAAVAAFQAGCDVILLPNDLLEAFHALVEAVETGEIDEQRLDDSVRRILQVKLGD